ncbi:MAG: hypothetical protein M1275_01585 [Patescibacteria group bacterium]|nr:hypothetical protein [Patescibacteria group bacterium]
MSEGSFSGEQLPLIRFSEIESYLRRPSFKRVNQELPNISREERAFLAGRVRRDYQDLKSGSEEKARQQQAEHFYDSLTLILCDPSERKMAYCPPDDVEEVVLRSRGDCLVFGTGTTGERIYFRSSQNEKQNGRMMQYPVPTESATEIGRKYYSRFCEAFGANEVNLDESS